jgi:hypothetical protein
MSPLLLNFLRRIAALSLILALFLAVGPRVLTELGLYGPPVDELVAAAARAVEAARVYGATESLPAYAAAQHELDSARRLAQGGRRREARHAAARASERALVAQREALIERDAERRQADAIVQDADRRLNELEGLYTRVTKGLDKTRVADLLTLMKSARQAGAGLVLAFDQDDYARVLADRDAALATLETARAELSRASGH